MAIITLRRPGCPHCQHPLRTGWPKFGPPEAKCGYCGNVVTTGLKPWATLSSQHRILIVIWEMLLPTLGGNPGVNLLFGLLAWGSLIGIPLLLLRLVLMISQSDAYSRTGLPPTWKYMSTQVASIEVPAPARPTAGTDRVRPANASPEATARVGVCPSTASATVSPGSATESRKRASVVIAVLLAALLVCVIGPICLVAAALVFTAPSSTSPRLAVSATSQFIPNPLIDPRTPSQSAPSVPPTASSGINDSIRPPAVPSPIIPTPPAGLGSATSLPTRVRPPVSPQLAQVVNRGLVGLAVLGWAPALPPEGSKLDAGKKLVMVDLVVINRDSKDLRPGFSFLLRDSSGQQWARDNLLYYPQGTRIPFERGLAPGERQRGQIVFQVPQDRSGYSLIYDPRDGSGSISLPLPPTPMAFTLPPELLSPDPATRNLGQAVRGGNATLSVLGWEIVPVDPNRSVRPDMQYVVVEAVVVNQGKQPIQEGGYRMFLKDKTGEQYDTDVLPLPRRCGGVDAVDRSFAPGERVRGKTAFFIDKDATDLVLVYDAPISGAFDKERVFVALGNRPMTADLPKDLPPDGLISTYAIGEAVQIGNLSLSVTGVTFPSTNAMRQPAAAGTKYLAVDVTAKNTGSEKEMIDESRQMNLRDEKDQYYACRFGGVPVTDLNQASWRNEIAPGEIRRGQVGFEVPLDAQKLIFVVRAGQNKDRIFISLSP